MRKIINPYEKLEGFECFGCSTKNNIGLNLDFFEDGEYVISRWKPRIVLQGYKGILHGGIQATLLDEVASWVVYVKAKTAGVTSRIDIKFRKPVVIDDGEVLIRAKITEQTKRIATIKAELINSKDQVCSEADIQYFIYNEQMAKDKMHYPGIESFFND